MKNECSTLLTYFYTLVMKKTLVLVLGNWKSALIKNVANIFFNSKTKTMLLKLYIVRKIYF